MNKRKQNLIESYFNTPKKDDQKRRKMEDSTQHSSLANDQKKNNWSYISGPELNLSTTNLYPSFESRQHIFSELETQISYLKDHSLTTIKVFGKTHNLPRKHAAYGNDGVTYTYSGIKIPARSWKQAPILEKVLEDVKHVTDINYNFVLINRYQNGLDKMGEHKDDERELDPSVPIASLSFGQERDFVFRHQNLVKKSATIKHSEKSELMKKLILKDGMLLLMNSPTNQFWYHSLPQRSTKVCPGVRINLTFRKIV